MKYNTYAFAFVMCIIYLYLEIIILSNYTLQEEKMKNKQNIITLSAYILLSVLFFMLGYFWGITSKPASRKSDYSEQIGIQSAALPTLSPTVDMYRLKISENKLILFKIEPDKSEEVYSIQISEDIFPPEDIESLKKGITFTNIYDAHTFIENFVS